MWINNATCEIVYFQVAIGRLALVSNDLAINFRHFSNDFASLFRVSTCATGFLTSIPIDIRYS